MRFHGGELDVSRAWPGFTRRMPTMRSSCWRARYQDAHPDKQVVLVTRDAAMRCKARARGVGAEDYYSDRPVTSPDKFYSGRVRIDLPPEQAGLLSSLHVTSGCPSRSSPTTPTCRSCS